MKKLLVKGIMFIILGFILGNFIFKNKNEIIKKISKEDTCYFIQEGVYKDETSLKKNLNLINTKAYDINNDEYHVYLGITKDYEIANELVKIYENRGYKTYLKKKKVLSKKFLNNVKQFDSLIKATTNEDKILTIEEVVLANYMQIINKK